MCQSVINQLVTTATCHTLCRCGDDQGLQQWQQKTHKPQPRKLCAVEAGPKEGRALKYFWCLKNQKEDLKSKLEGGRGCGRDTEKGQRRVVWGPRIAEGLSPSDAGRTQHSESLETTNRREDEGQSRELCPYQSREADLRLAESTRDGERGWRATLKAS